MRHLARALGIAFLVAATAVATRAANAESRLFTVRTDSPAVTVVQAVRNGVQLAVAGQSGGATFFRIDNPSGPVPCANRIMFTASNGASVDASVDLCASNWELVVAVASGGGTLPGARPVIVTTDDPAVTITEVFLRGKPVPIDAAQGRYVRIFAPVDPQGNGCQRDLGLALSDGRRIARLVDICQTNYVVVVALVGGPRPPPPPSNFLPAIEQPVMVPPVVAQPQPQPPPPPPQPQPLPLPQPSGPEVVTGMVWMFSASASTGSLAYGLPNSDASEFTAVCQAGSGRATVTLNRAPPGLVPGAQLPVGFTAGAFSKVYTATASPVSELSGHPNPVMQIAISDALWAALIKESLVAISIGQMPPYALSLSGSAARAKQFLAVCSQPVVQPQPLPQPLPPPTPGPSANAIGFTCNDGSFISVAFDQAAAVVNEAGAPPVVLLRTADQGGARYVGGMSELIGYAQQIQWTRDGYARMCQRN